MISFEILAETGRAGKIEHAAHLIHGIKYTH